MGGEWFFYITTPKDGGSVLDLKAYQKLLKEIKAEYETKFIPENNKWYSAWHDGHSGEEAYWWNDDNSPLENNIFAAFKYKCTRHTWHNENLGMRNCKNLEFTPEKPVWCLFWDPTIVEDRGSCSDVHARCAPEWFKVISDEIQTKIVRAFPQHFYLYWGDGISGSGDYTFELGTP